MGIQIVSTSALLRRLLGALITSASALSLLTLNAGCTTVFFQPSKTRYPYLELDKLSAEPVTLISRDQTKISAWRIRSTLARRNHPEIKTAIGLKPEEARGLSLQFHGNAENMTSHYRFQMWLLFEGWDVLTFDYRGYGQSEGHPKNLDGVREDGIAAIHWAGELAEKENKPLVIFAQSLGGSLALSALKELSSLDESASPPKNSVDRLKLLVIDSAFYSFTSIAREKLSGVWFLWPFQWLGWLLVSNDLSAAQALKFDPAKGPGLFTTPALFLHSENDPIVSNQQGERLFELYPGPKERWTTKEPGHVNTLFSEATNEAIPKSPHREKLKIKLIEIFKSGEQPTSK